MKLSIFILENMEQILAEWEAFARTLLPATKGMTVDELRDHAQALLETIAKDLDTPQSAYEQNEKAQGQRTQALDGQDTAAQIHAGLRAKSRLKLTQMLAEYRALRASVLRLWSKDPQGSLGTVELDR